MVDIYNSRLNDQKSFYDKVLQEQEVSFSISFVIFQEYTNHHSPHPSPFLPLPPPITFSYFSRILSVLSTKKSKNWRKRTKKLNPNCHPSVLKTTPSRFNPPSFSPPPFFPLPPSPPSNPLPLPNREKTHNSQKTSVLNVPKRTREKRRL